MATMVTSFRGAVDEWLGAGARRRPLSARRGRRGFDPATPGAARGDAGRRARIAFSRQLPLTLAADRPPVTPDRAARAATRRDPLLVLIDAAPTLPAGALPVWVSEPAARLYGWRPGDDDRAADRRAARASRSPASGATMRGRRARCVIDEADYQRLTGDATRDEAAVDARARRAMPTRVGRALIARAAAGAARPASTIAEPATLRRFALDAVRPQLRGHLSARGGGDPRRAGGRRRDDVGADDRARARVRHAAPSRRHASGRSSRCSRPRARCSGWSAALAGHRRSAACWRRC